MEKIYHGSTEPFWIIVEDNDSEKILHYEILFIKSYEASNDYGSTLYVRKKFFLICLEFFAGSSSRKLILKSAPITK